MCVSSVSLCQCLNADGGHKADENCSKRTYIKGPLGLCSTVSATGDILGLKPFITLNTRCGTEPPLNPAGTDQDRDTQRQREKMKVSILSLHVLQFAAGQQHEDASSKSRGKPFKGEDEIMVNKLRMTAAFFLFVEEEQVNKH